MASNSTMAGNETAADEVASELDKSPMYYVVIKYGLHSVEALLIVGGNALTLVAVKRTKKLRDIPTNTFIVSLAASDGMIGVFLPFMIAVKFFDSPSVWDISTCVLRGPYYTMFCISLSTLLAIAVDRYVAVVHPLYYRRTMTIRAARLISVLIWVIEFVFMTSLTCYYGTSSKAESLQPEAAHDLFPKKITLWLLQTMVLVPLAGNIVLYLWIYVKLRQKNALVMTMETNAVQPSKKTKAFTKMMALVLGYLVLAWLPYYILVPMHNITDPSTPRWYVYTFDVAMVLFYSNSFMNPFIYSWKSRDFKEAYAKILNCSGPSESADRNISLRVGNTSTTMSIA